MTTILVKELNADRPAIISLKPRRVESIDFLRGLVKGYGFNLVPVYIIWIGLIMLLFPFCKWFARYKKTHSSEYRWLSYL